MSDLIIKKNGTDYKLPMLAEHYPADRVYLHGDITENVEDEIGNSKIFRKTINLQGVALNSQDNGYNYTILTNQVPDGYYIIGVSLGGSFTCGLFCMPQVRSLVVFSNLSSITNNRPVYLYYAKATDV